MSSNLTNNTQRQEKYDECTQYCIDTLLQKGASKASCSLSIKKNQELNAAHGQMTLNRTTNNITLILKAIIKHKIATLVVNNLDKDTIDNAIDEVLILANSSKDDVANDISLFQEAQEFSSGPVTGDINKMYDLFANYLSYSKETYPKTIIEEAMFEFVKSINYFRNSNKVDFFAQKGYYSFFSMFTSKEGTNISSFNYNGFDTNKLDKEIKEYASINTLLEQSSEQIFSSSIDDKFVGDIIISPDCLMEFISYLTGYLKDNSLITKTSIYQDKLNKKIADKRFTLHSNPVGENISNGYFITGDGYEAQNRTIIENGVLKTFLLSQYAAKKTNMQRAVNQGGAYEIKKGETSYLHMLPTVHKGILLCRFSGGYPAQNGDFSGVAKNSYYIENGEIKHPINETMISGNLEKLFLNIKDISSETINFGDSILPWMSFLNVTVSGK